MDSLTYYYWTVAITFVYFAFLMAQSRFRLILPSVVHTFAWLITSLLVICQLKGALVTNHLTDNAVDKVSVFTCYIVIASIIGFSCAHFVMEKYEFSKEAVVIDATYIESLLSRFKWVPYTCGAVGLLLFIFLITTIGKWETFSDYRVLALQTERVGYAAIAQRISGHISILGGFYLMLLGYKYGQKGRDIKGFLFCALLCSTINISIGGRVWILTSTLPFITTFVFSRFFLPQRYEQNTANDIKSVLAISAIFIILFSVIGMMRTIGDKGNMINKFLYLTDGTRMTNMVMNTFPEGTFPHEHGTSTLLGGLIQSPMVSRFAHSISSDIGLSVTVKSIMPNLYYDFGIVGGAIFYGLICFFFEMFCIRLKYSSDIIALLTFGTISTILFNVPVGNVFSINTPTFEWIILLLIFRKYIFRETEIVENN